MMDRTDGRNLFKFVELASSDRHSSRIFRSSSGTPSSSLATENSIVS